MAITSAQTQQPGAPAARSRAPVIRPRPPEREKKLLKFYRSRWGWFLNYLIGFVILGTGIYLYFYGPLDSMINIGVIVLGVIILIVTELGGIGTRYYITQYRVIEVLGILKKKQHALSTSEIEGIRVRQGVFNRILGIGDIEIKTARDSLILKKVADPNKIESLILSKARRWR